MTCLVNDLIPPADLLLVFLFNRHHTGPESFRAKYVIITDDMAPCVAKSSIAMISTMSDSQALLCHYTWFQLFVPFLCEKMIYNTFTNLCFQQKSARKAATWWCDLFFDYIRITDNLLNTWWRHQMETVSALLALCAGNDRWIPLTKASDAELWCFLWSAPWINGWLNNREAGDLRRHSRSIWRHCNEKSPYQQPLRIKNK